MLNKIIAQVLIISDAELSMYYLYLPTLNLYELINLLILWIVCFRLICMMRVNKWSLIIITNILFIKV